MANAKISQLPTVLNEDVGNASVLPIVDSNDTITKKISLNQLDLRWEEKQTVQEAPLANNTTENVDGLVFSLSSVRSVFLVMTVFRDETVDRCTSGTLILVNDGTTWYIGNGGFASDAGCVFDINPSTGQVTSTNDNGSGFVSGYYRWQILSTIGVNL